MAIFHMSAQTITRSKGHSSVAAAAYRHGEKLTDEHTGEIHDYSKKKGVSDSVILIPDGADRNFLKPEYLWNTIEKSEKRKDAQLAREFNIALPVEMSDKQKKALAIDFCNENFIKNGMIADIAFHKLDSENPHFHVMLTTRRLTPDGSGFGQKERKWNDKEQLEQWRKEWADTANEHLQAAGINARIDHRSLKEQKAALDALHSPTIEQQAQAISLDRPATIHRGHTGNTERHARFDALQEVKVSQETKALNHIEQNTLKPSPLAPASSHTASANDATKGSDDKQPVAQKGIKNKGSAAPVSSFNNMTEYRESADKNLHLSEAQKIELEQLEEEEKRAKSYLSADTGGGVPASTNEYNPQSTNSFKNKFHAAKQSISFTEQRFNEEREAYESRRNRPIPR